MGSMSLMGKEPLNGSQLLDSEPVAGVGSVTEGRNRRVGAATLALRCRQLKRPYHL